MIKHMQNLALFKTLRRRAASINFRLDGCESSVNTFSKGRNDFFKDATFL